MIYEVIKVKFAPPESTIISHHPFRQPRIRLWLPAMMVSLMLLCGWITAPRIRIVEFIAILFLGYVATSSLVSVCEIAVTNEGLLINRVVLPERFIPWNDIDRVLIFSRENEGSDVMFEMVSIGFYEGLSPLNRLPGPVYGQGWRQTIIITPDTLINYDLLLEHLENHCVIERQAARQ